MSECAGVAQQAEQLICNQQVAGSIPVTSSKRSRALRPCTPGHFLDAQKVTEKTAKGAFNKAAPLESPFTASPATGRDGDNASQGSSRCELHDCRCFYDRCRSLDVIVGLRHTTEYGGVPEWPKGADCKSVVNDFGGSNPPSSTKRKDTPLGVPFLLGTPLSMLSRCYLPWRMASIRAAMSFIISGMFIACGQTFMHLPQPSQQ